MSYRISDGKDSDSVRATALSHGKRKGGNVERRQYSRNVNRQEVNGGALLHGYNTCASHRQEHLALNVVQVSDHNIIEIIENPLSPTTICTHTPSGTF